MSPAGHRHGRIAARFTAKLAPFVEEHRLGECFAAETGFILQRNPDTVRAPDVAFVGRERLRATTIAEEGFFPGPPDLAVEVVSPGDSYLEVEAKVGAWLDAGTRVVVVLDPQRSVAAVHRSTARTETLGVGNVLALSDLVPGWTLSLEDLFRPSADA